MSLESDKKRFMLRAAHTYSQSKEKDTPQQLAKRMSFVDDSDIRVVKLLAVSLATKAG